MTSPRPLLLILLSVGVLDGSARVAFCGCVPDSDADGVCDSRDLCPATIPGADVDADGCPRKAPADFDFDGDVDLEDLNVMRGCLRGPGASIVDAPECEDADFDFDQDVDLGDIGIFVGCFGGADVPSDPNCVSPRIEIVGGCLRIIDTAVSTALSLRLEPGDSTTLQIDFGDDGSPDFSAHRPLFDCIQVFARGGNDVVRIDDANGVFTIEEVTTLDGGSGDDLLLGGNGPEFLGGGTGDDRLEGNQNADTAILGGDDDNDTLSGGPGADQLFGGPGGDRFIWNPGDDSDLMEGGDGTDSVEVNGDDESEQFTITANGVRVRFDRISPAPFALDIGTCESLQLSAGRGDDLLSCSGNLVALIQITADGEEGDDTLLGGNGADVLIGGDGNDIIDGNQGGDVVFLGPGDDFFQWDPGDGSDTIEGQGDHDLLLFNGSNVAENLVFSSDGSRLHLTRDVALVTLDASGVEQVILLVGGGADNIVVNNLRETDVEEIDISLALFGGMSGDGQADTVSVNGASDADDLTITSGSDGIWVVDPSTLINITAAEPSLDRLMVNGLGGHDRIQAGDLESGAITLTINGGAGNDILQGSAGPDLILGDEDNDTISGGPGDDQLSGGSGNDRFIWNPGDNTDLMEGGGGADRVDVNGGDEAENFLVTANGTRIRFERLDPAPFDLDIGGSEALFVYAHGGNDDITCTGNLVALIQMTVDGGPGEDTILGGNGADVLIGGDDNDFIDGNQGADVVSMGAGDDIFQWDPGDGNDTVEGQAGWDTLRFQGSNSAEAVDLSSNGPRLRLSRSIGSVVMDCNDLEHVDFNALGGADTATVNDLTGTDVVEVNIGLAASGGGAGDLQSDSVMINATSGDDVVAVAATSGGVSILGLAAAVTISQSEPVKDRLTINALAGNDVVDASSLTAGIIEFIAFGGDDNDMLIGSDGADVLLGGDGDDTLIGGPGDDVLDGGSGDNVLIP